MSDHHVIQAWEDITTLAPDYPLGKFSHGKWGTGCRFWPEKGKITLIYPHHWVSIQLIWPLRYVFTPPLCLPQWQVRKRSETRRRLKNLKNDKMARRAKEKEKGKEQEKNQG